MYLVKLGMRRVTAVFFRPFSRCVQAVPWGGAGEWAQDSAHLRSGDRQGGRSHGRPHRSVLLSHQQHHRQ